MLKKLGLLLLYPFDGLLRRVVTWQVQSGRGASPCKQCGHYCGRRAINGTVSSSGNEYRWQERVFCFDCGEFACAVSDCDQKATATLSGVLFVGHRPRVDVPADLPICEACLEKTAFFQTRRLQNVLMLIVAGTLFLAFLCFGGALGHIAFGGTLDGLGDKLVRNYHRFSLLRFALWVLVVAMVIFGTVLEYRVLRRTPRERKRQYNLEVTGEYGSRWKDVGMPSTNPSALVALIDLLFNAFRR
ncbi:MAG: hypothetical protein GXY83_26275 [Rhodopirellula sp.]|nr:hypothetical protein [Rhodopirellula sp.]